MEWKAAVCFLSLKKLEWKPIRKTLCTRVGSVGLADCIRLRFGSSRVTRYTA